MQKLWLNSLTNYFPSFTRVVGFGKNITVGALPGTHGSWQSSSISFFYLLEIKSNWQQECKKMDNVMWFSQELLAERSSDVSS